MESKSGGRNRVFLILLTVFLFSFFILIIFLKRGKAQKDRFITDVQLRTLSSLSLKEARILTVRETESAIENFVNEIIRQIEDGLINSKGFGNRLEYFIKTRSIKELKKRKVFSTNSTSSNLGPGAPISLPEIGKTSLPSTEGVSVSTFTGKSNLKLSFSLPKIRGNLPLSFSLIYSSSFIDELRLNHPSLSQLAKALRKEVSWFFKTEEGKKELEKAKPWDVYQYGANSLPYGLGWSLESSLGVIRVDPDNENSYLLTLNGENIRIKYDPEKNTFSTYPKNKVKIERLTALGAWRITDEKGTIYIFGNPASYKHENGEIEPSEEIWKGDWHFSVVKIPKQSANEYKAELKAQYNYQDHYPFYTCENRKITAWHLTYIEDVFGNRAKVLYEQDVRYLLNEKGAAHLLTNCGYTAAIYPKEIRYNFDGKEYLTRVRFNYKKVEIGNPYDSEGRLKGQVKKEEAAIISYPVKDRILQNIEIFNNGRLIKRWEFKYKLSFKNPKLRFSCIGSEKMGEIRFKSGINQGKDYCDEKASGENKVRQWLLTEVVERGFQGKGKKRPIKLCYASMKDYEKTKSRQVYICSNTNTEALRDNTTPNDIYLVSYDNGYGGKIEFEYKRKSWKLKTQKDKGLSDNYEPLFNPLDEVGIIDNICSNTPWSDIFLEALEEIKKGRKPQKYVRGCTGKDGNLRFLESRKTYTSLYLVSKQIRKVKQPDQKERIRITEYIYKGTPTALASTFYPKDKYGYSRVAGFRFLGFPEVRVRVYDGKTKKIYSDVIEKTHLTLQTGEDQSKDEFNGSRTNNSCIMQDPRYGADYEKLIFDDRGRQIGREQKDWIIAYDFKQQDPNKLCYPFSQDQARIRSFIAKEEGEILGKKSKKEYFYDFQVYPGDKKRNFGNLVKTINWGDPGKDGDEIFSYIKYKQDRSIYKPEELEKYTKANLISLKESVFTSDLNKAKPDDVPRDHRFNWQTFSYDEPEFLPEDLRGKPLGILTSTKNIVIGLSKDDSKEHHIVLSQNYYNKWGLVRRQVLTGDKVVDTYYDSHYHLYPTCQVRWKLPLSDKRVVYDENKVCNFDKPGEKLVKIYGYKDEDLDRGLLSYHLDENQARSEFVYDEYGRVIKVFGPNPEKKGTAYSQPISEAEYFDELPIFATRIKTRNFIPRESGFKTEELVEESFYDGVGKLLEKVAYGKKDREGKPYITLFYQTLNSNDQVLEQYKGIVINDKALVGLKKKPEFISFSKIQSFLTNPVAPFVETTTKYDFISRPIKVIVRHKDKNGEIDQTQRFSYEGYITHKFDANGNQTTVISDGLGRVQKTISYLCSPSQEEQSVLNCTKGKGKEITTSLVYHPALKDKVLKVLDTDGKVIDSYIYNNQGMVLSYSNADRGKTDYYYDEKLQLVKTIDANNNQIINHYDHLGRKVKTEVKGKDGKLYYFTLTDYDSAEKNAIGRVYKGQVWAKNLPSWFSKDRENILLSSTETTFDLLGNPVKLYSQILDPTILVEKGKIEYLDDRTLNFYSPTGIISKSVKASKFFENAFANGSNKIFSLSYQYDDNGRLISVFDELLDKYLFKQVIYDEKERLTKVVYPNNTQVSYTYDPASRLKEKIVERVDATEGGRRLFDSQYSFDLNNQLIKIEDKVGALDKNNLKSYISYDSLGRLDRVYGDEVEADYLFDLNGNLLKKNEVSKLSTSLSSKAESIWYFKKKGCDNEEYKSKTGYTSEKYGCPYHAPKKAVINGKVFYYLYDKKGNLLKEIDEYGRVVRKYLYEIPVLDLPTTIKVYEQKVKSPNVEKTIQTKTVVHNFYIYPNTRILQIVKDGKNKIKSIVFYANWYQKEKKGEVVKETIFYPSPLGRIIKQRENKGDWKTYYIFSNHQSSTTLVTDGEGRLVPELQKIKQIKYLPYGLLAVSPNLEKLPTKQLYTNQYFDDEIGLYYYNARFYNPNLGVFISADPVQDGLNRYAYVSGNPVILEDPSGTCPNCVGAVIGFFGGAIISGATDAIVQYATTGHIEWGSVAVSAVQGGAEGACIGATGGIGAAGICTGVSSAAGFAAQTAYNLIKGEDAKTAVVHSARDTAVATVAGLGMGVVGRASVFRGGLNLPREAGSAKRFIYTSSSRGWKLIIDRNEDALLLKHIRRAVEYIGSRRVSARISRVDLAMEYVRQIPHPGEYPNMPQLARRYEELYSRGVQYLGAFCEANVMVCREKAFFLREILREVNPGLDVIVEVGNLRQGGRHAWVRILNDTARGEIIVDPTMGVIRSVRRYYREYNIDVGSILRFKY